MDVEDIRGKYKTSSGDETLIIDYRLRTTTAYDISGITIFLSCREIFLQVILHRMNYRFSFCSLSFEEGVWSCYILS